MPTTNFCLLYTTHLVEYLRPYRLFPLPYLLRIIAFHFTNLLNLGVLLCVKSTSRHGLKLNVKDAKASAQYTGYVRSSQARPSVVEPSKTECIPHPRTAHIKLLPSHSTVSSNVIQPGEGNLFFYVVGARHGLK